MQLKAAIAQGPVVVYLDANDPMFTYYESGIIDSTDCGRDVNHAGTAIGYGEDYCIVKNVWGSDFGDNGYVKIGTGDEENGGICGILRIESYPVVY